MKKIIKQSSLIILAGIMTLTLGCGGSSSSVFTPDSLSGKVVTGSILTGTEDFDATGTFITTFTSSGFVEVTGVDTLSGTYVYTKLSFTQAVVVETATSDVGTITATLTFTSATGGTYSAIGSLGIEGTQTGTFITN